MCTSFKAIKKLIMKSKVLQKEIVDEGKVFNKMKFK